MPAHRQSWSASPTRSCEADAERFQKEPFARDEGLLPGLLSQQLGGNGRSVREGTARGDSRGADTQARGSRVRIGDGGSGAPAESDQVRTAERTVCKAPWNLPPKWTL